MNERPVFTAEANDNTALARDLLRASERILVTTHRHPDGDAVGSALATGRALQAAGKTVTVHTPDPPPTFLRFLPGFATITQNAGELSAYDLIIALDHSELTRTGLNDQLQEARRPVIAIDHHATADRKASIVFVVPEAAATGELLASLFPHFELPLDAGTATCLLTGIITDTGFFQHANTTAHVLATAEQLVARGADLRSIVVHVTEERSLASLRIAGRALERLTVNRETGGTISVVTKRDLEECRADIHDLTGVVNLLNTIPEASFALLLTEVEGGKVKGSLRSAVHRPVDVAAIARQFGGGGHRLASGFEIAGRLVRDATGWQVE